MTDLQQEIEEDEHKWIHNRSPEPVHEVEGVDVFWDDVIVVDDPAGEARDIVQEILRESKGVKVIPVVVGREKWRIGVGLEGNGHFRFLGALGIEESRGISQEYLRGESIRINVEPWNVRSTTSGEVFSYEELEIVGDNVDFSSLD